MEVEKKNGGLILTSDAEVPLALNAKDYTFYVPRKTGLKIIRKAGHPSDRTFAELKLTVRNRGNGERRQAKQAITGRALVASCFGGDAFSITIRKEDGTTSEEYSAQKVPVDPGKCGYEPSHVAPHPFCVPTESSCETIFSALFRRPQAVANGLLLITGATDVAKSTIARGLIYKFLLSLPSGDRRRHLVTFEDPIEKPFAYAGEQVPSLQNCLDGMVDYTPQQKTVDVPTLQAALQNAKRQTPTVFYVGEARTKADLGAAMDFAASGHLIVSTAHSGSLTEAIQMLFAAVNAKTPADRGQYAQRILAVVHQRNVSQPVNGVSFIATLPALWRQTASGRAALVSDGLASLLPNYASDIGIPHAMSSIGRFWFGEKLLKGRSAPHELDADAWKSAVEGFLEQARQHDLRGI
jgi:hypothetical protein